jgi:hypothetical protein
MNFEPTADVKDILKTLRENKLAWIADEIESTIGSGKLTTKRYSEPGKKKVKTGTMTVAFDEKEQERILTTVLRNYLIGLQKLWTQAQEKFSGVFEETAAKASIVSPETGQEMELFSSAYAQQYEKLDRLLKLLSPDVYEDQQDDELSEDSI